MNFLKKIFKKKEQLNKTIKAQPPKDSAEAKKIATKNKEPYIEVVGLDIDAENPVQGAFELDWNKYFVDELRTKGFVGDTDEDVVDQWFNQVCKNVALSQWDDYPEGNRNSFVETTDIGDGRKEIK
tara:strand:- start:1139 stop:1516 length:378 start_codon:yes stop_codon:yes gene_type:complete